jgi:hypothetical protein
MLSLSESPLLGPFDVPPGVDYWRARFTPDSPGEWQLLPGCPVPVEVWTNPAQPLLCVAYDVDPGVYRVAVETPWRFRLDIIVGPTIQVPGALLAHAVQADGGCEMKLRMAVSTS